MSDVHDDPAFMSTEEKDALIIDPINRGLTAREVIERLGSGITGTDSTVRRVRRGNGLDTRGYPLHSSHHFNQPLPTVADPANDRTVERVMGDSPHRPISSSPFLRPRRRCTTRARRWPDGECVYFIQADGGGPIKIGCTRDLDHRYADLAAASPVPLAVIGFIHGYRPTEQHLHGLFAADRLHGEWFRPTERLVALAEGRLFLGSNGRLRERT